MTVRHKVAVAERWRPGSAITAETAAKRALATVARRWRSLDHEARELTRHIKAILDDVAPDLIAVHGVGYETAGQLLVTAGDNPDDCARRSPSPPCAARPQSRRRRAGPPGIGSTAVVIVTPAQRCGPSCSSA